MRPGHRRLLLVAAFHAGLIAIISGAYISSVKAGSPASQPEPNPSAHRVIALLAIGLAGAVVLAGKGSVPQRILIPIATAALIAGAATGRNYPLSPGAAAWHAAFAHLFMIPMVVAVLLAGIERKLPLPRIAAGQWTALRPAAMLAPAAVFGQIIMGALYRHQLTGIMPHMLGAMIVALLTMVVSAVVLQNFAERRELKGAATALISVVLVQLCLGIAVFLMLLLKVGSGSLFIWIATAHVTVGALVLAASLKMAIEASRHIARAKSVG